MNETSIPSPSNVSNDSKSTSGFSLALSVVVDAGVVVVVVVSVVDDVFVVDRVVASEKKKIKKKSYSSICESVANGSRSLTLKSFQFNLLQTFRGEKLITGNSINSSCEYIREILS